MKNRFKRKVPDGVRGFSVFCYQVGTEVILGGVAAFVIGGPGALPRNIVSGGIAAWMLSLAIDAVVFLACLIPPTKRELAEAEARSERDAKWSDL